MAGLIPVAEPKTREEMIARARVVSDRLRGAVELPPPPVKRDWIFVATGSGQLATRSTFATKETKMSRVRSTRHAKRIISWVCRRFKLDAGEIFSNRRTSRVVKPRQLAVQMIAHSRHCEALSLPDIGRLFGGRDHTTILHSARLAPSYQRRYSTEAYKKQRPNCPRVPK